MIIKLPTKDIFIEWHYSRKTKEESQDITTCFIYDGETRLVDISEGMSFCSKKDNFSKEVGRKISLTRALQNGNFSKSDRKYIWDAYRTRAER